MNIFVNHRAFGYSTMALTLAAVGIVTIAENKPVFAQLTPDNTLGAESSIVTPQQLRNLIQGGAIRGNALFHSFDEFNVGDGGSVFFDLQNNTDILNIFTRITGTSSSNILGTLGVLQDALNSDDLGNANLFLLNPNGITFGANANLQLNGSFFATTADSFDFDDFSFSASEPEPPPLLTISIPRFASFRDNPGDIAVNQGSLSVNQGQSLSLVGGNVTVSGSGDINNPILNLGTPDGRIEIGSMASSGAVSLTQTDAGLVLGYEGIETFGDITFNQLAYVDTSGEGGGSIQLQGRDINLSENTGFFADTLGVGTGDGIVVNSEQLIIEDGSFLNAVVFGSGQGGDLTITTSNLLIQDGAQIAVGTAGEGDGGDLTVTASNLLIQDGSQVIVGTAGEGDGGDLTVNVSDSIEMIGISPDPQSPIPTALVTTVFPGATGNAGDLIINTSYLQVQGGAAVSTGTSGEGNGGILTVNATDSIDVIGTSAEDLFASGLSAQADPGSTGNAGNLIINTSNLLIQDGALVSTSTFGEGDGGNLTANVTDFIQVIGGSQDGSLASDLVARAAPGSTGNGGNLTINTSRLLAQDGGQVSVDTLGEGNAGNLIVNATDSIQVIGRNEFGSGSSVSAGAIRDFTGNAGNLIINTPQLQVQDGGQVSATTSGEGNAGNLTINTSELLAQDSGQISTSTFGEGDAGNLTINATNFIQVIGTSADNQPPSGLFSQANRDSTGSAGDVTISTSNLLIQDGGLVSTSTFGEGDGGELTITSDNLTLDNGIIAARTANADGGNVNLNIADLLLLRNGNSNALISATAGGEGNGGNLTINTTFLVAFPNENTDITANGTQGRGGNINITATGVLGMQFRDTLTESSDITATSDFGISGTVTLNTPETQINQEQIEQLEEVVDSSDIVSQSACGNFGGDSQFANTGRGGVPQIPGFIVRNDVVNVDLVDEVLLPAPPPQAIKPHHRTDVTFIDSEGEEFKPAMGAVLLPNGMVEFVDYNPAEVYRDMYAAAGCLSGK